MTSAAWQSSLGPHGELWTLRVVPGAHKLQLALEVRVVLGVSQQGCAMIFQGPRKSTLCFVSCLCTEWEEGRERLGGVTQNLGSPVNGCGTKRHIQAKIRRRKGLLFAASRENTGSRSQSSVSPNSRTGEAFISACMHIHGGGGETLGWYMHIHEGA